MIAALALAVALPAVQIQATDYALAMPARIPQGLTTFAFENKGSEPHSLRFVRIGPGHSLSDFAAWQKTADAIPAWLESSGGIGTIAPGGTEEFTASLAPGSYVALCAYPSRDGGTHLQRGMFAAVEVGPNVSGGTPPTEDLTVTMHDHGFQLTAPVSVGKSIWRIHNNGSEPHQALLVRLPEGVDEWQERTWFNDGGRAPRGGVAMGGVLELAPDADAWFSVTLTPGTYLLICTMLEEEGRHFDLGMIYHFTVE
ncbi:MAG TPA: hypothetical protein VGY48_03915 [Vicinamibacterales bacterium]|jgi:hypothetical protein|nr:hypothetical protein [Vicinamibacterales bacterium]